MSYRNHYMCGGEATSVTVIHYIIKYEVKVFISKDMSWSISKAIWIVLQLGPKKVLSVLAEINSMLQFVDSTLQP